MGLQLYCNSRLFAFCSFIQYFERFQSCFISQFCFLRFVSASRCFRLSLVFLFVFPERISLNFHIYSQILSLSLTYFNFFSCVFLIFHFYSLIFPFFSHFFSFFSQFLLKTDVSAGFVLFFSNFPLLNCLFHSILSSSKKQIEKFSKLHASFPPNCN